MARRRSGYIQIDVNEYIDEIDDHVLVEEVKARKLSLDTATEPPDLDIVREAYEELLRGRSAEARSVLERILFPKWRSVESAKNAYTRAISGGDQNV